MTTHTDYWLSRDHDDMPIWFKSERKRDTFARKRGGFWVFGRLVQTSGGDVREFTDGAVDL